MEMDGETRVQGVGIAVAAEMVGETAVQGAGIAEGGGMGAFVTEQAWELRADPECGPCCAFGECRNRR